MNRVKQFVKLLLANVSTVCLVCIVATAAFYFSPGSGNPEDQAFKPSLAAIVAFRILLFLIPAAFVASVIGVASNKYYASVISGSLLAAALLFLIDNPLADDARQAAGNWESFGGKLIFYQICWLIAFVLSRFIGNGSTRELKNDR